MTPTQEQIETLAKAMYQNENDDIAWERLNEKYKRAYRLEASLTLTTKWQPIATAPKEIPVLICKSGWMPCIAEQHKEAGWVQYLSGEFYGLGPPYKPTHWMSLPAPPAGAA